MTIKVRALKEHGNRAGFKYRKAEGDEYDLPEERAKALAAIGLVEVADEQSPEVATAPIPRRTRKRK